MLLSTISFIYFFILFKYRKSPTPKSILLEAKESLEGLKYNIDVFFGGVWGYTGGGDRYVHCSKRGHFIEVSQHLSLLVA